MYMQLQGGVFGNTFNTYQEILALFVLNAVLKQNWKLTKTEGVN